MTEFNPLKSGDRQVSFRWFWYSRKKNALLLSVCTRKQKTMPVKKCLAAILFLLGSYVTSFAQYPPRYFSDTNTKVLPYRLFHPQAIGNHFYMYARSLALNGGRINVVIKADTIGNLKWVAHPYQYTAADSLYYNSEFSDAQLIMGSDNHLYMMHPSDTFTFSSSNQMRVISKIDDNNGDVKWITRVADNGFIKNFVRITDYSPTELLVSSFRSSTTFSISKISKATGRTIATNDYAGGNVDLGESYNFESATRMLYVDANKALYIFFRDTCYKYNSFDNNTLAWKVKWGSADYSDIRKVIEDNGVLYVLGTKKANGYAGLGTAINMTTGAVQWQELFFMDAPTFVANITLCDARLYNNRLYTTWQHRFVGSISEKCYINCRDKNTGAILWQNNYDFASGSTSGGAEQAMVSMDVDGGGNLFLTGYVPYFSSQQYDWGFMKIRGSDGALLRRNRAMKLSVANTSNDEGFVAKLYGNSLYTLGYRTTSNMAFDQRQINIIRLDTATMTSMSYRKIEGQLQYSSVAWGLRDFSANKKIILKNTGRRLQLEMTDNALNTLWTTNLGNTTDYYEGFPEMGVNLNKRIFVAAKRYRFPIAIAQMLSEYSNINGYQVNDSMFIFELDSTGLLRNTYRYPDNYTITPLRFITDTPTTKTFIQQYNKAAPGFTINSISHYSFAAGEGIFGNSVNSVTGRIPFLQTRNMYNLPGDTLIGFQTTAGTLTRVVKTKILPPVQNVFTVLPAVRVIYDVEKIANNQYFIAGQDSLQRDFVMRLNTYGNIRVWRNTYDTFQNTIKVMAMDTTVYTLTKKGRHYLVGCLGANTGAAIWSLPVPTLPNNILEVSDFKVNTVNKTITVLGASRDTTDKYNERLYYAYTFKADGSELFRMEKTGDKGWVNRGTFLYIDRDNRTLSGGTHHFNPFGYAGCILAADQAAGYFTINNGNWNDPATWAGGIVPPADAAVIVRHNITVTANATCYTLTIEQPGGGITVNTGVVLTITH
jgi:hypothetical protein